MPGPFTPHPDRGPAEAEIHARPIPPLRAPARVRRLGFLFGQDQALALDVRARLDAYCAVPSRAARSFDFATSDHQVTWEFHTEFATVTWIGRFDDPDPPPPNIGLEAVAALTVAFAARVDIMATPAISAAALAGFDERSLCYASIDRGRAQVATDFLPDAAGYTRYELASGELGPHVAGAIVRRLLEIESYRVLALVGIGLARAETSRLGELEARLASAMNAIGQASGPSASAGVLDQMYALQHDVSHSVERTRYRFAASRAYGDILLQRLHDLDEGPYGDYRTLQTFLRQRVEPALATIRATARRQTALLEQAAQSTALIGTRISLDIDTQNRSILTTISDTAKSQFRLQRTVEGLSAIAITYYLLGIVTDIVKGIAPEYEHEKAIAIAVLTPLALLLVWAYLRRVRRH